MQNDRLADIVAPQELHVTDSVAISVLPSDDEAAPSAGGVGFVTGVLPVFRFLQKRNTAIATTAKAVAAMYS